MTEPMHVFTNHDIFVVAHSVEEAAKLCDVDDWELYVDEFKQLPDEQKLTVCDDESEDVFDETHTCGEWAAMFSEPTEIARHE